MSKSDRRFIIVMILLAACLRLYRLGQQSLWVDEILTYIVSNPKEGLNIWDYLKYNLHGPFHIFVVYLFSRINDGEAWLRLPSAIAGAASIYFLYRWVHEWLGAQTARISTFLLVIHPLHIHYSQELRNYSFVLLFGLLANFLFHRLLAEGKKRLYVCYVFAIALAALSNFIAAFLFATHSVIWFIRKGVKRPIIFRWIIVGVAILILISPWVYRIYKVIDVSKLVTPVMPGELTASERLRGETTITATALPYMCYAFSAGFTLGPSLRELHQEASLGRVISDHMWTIGWVALLFASLASAGIAACRADKRGLLELFLYLLIPVLCTFLLCWQNAKAFNVRYVLLSLPAYLCLLACGLAAVPRRWVALVWLALLVTEGWSLANHYFNDRYAKEDVRAAARIITAREKQGDCILVPTVKEVFEHYYHGRASLHNVYARHWSGREAVEERLGRLFAECDTFWYVRTREWVDDPEGHIVDILTRKCMLLDSIDITGVTLMYYQLKSASPR